MKRIRRFVKKLPDMIYFVLGPVLMLGGLVSFTPCGGGRGGRGGYASGIYYKDEIETQIMIGVALICFGLLRKYWQRPSKAN